MGIPNFKGKSFALIYLEAPLKYKVFDTGEEVFSLFIYIYVKKLNTKRDG